MDKFRHGLWEIATDDGHFDFECFFPGDTYEFLVKIALFYTSYACIHILIQIPIPNMYIYIYKYTLYIYIEKNSWWDAALMFW